MKVVGFWSGLMTIYILGVVSGAVSSCKLSDPSRELERQRLIVSCNQRGGELETTYDDDGLIDGHKCTTKKKEPTQGVRFDVPVKSAEGGCTLIITDESGVHLTTVAVECPR